MNIIFEKSMVHNHEVWVSIFSRKIITMKMRQNLGYFGTKRIKCEESFQYCFLRVIGSHSSSYSSSCFLSTLRSLEMPGRVQLYDFGGFVGNSVPLVVHKMVLVAYFNEFSQGCAFCYF